MFEKKKIDKYAQTLREQVAANPRIQGCRIAMGKAKLGAYVRTTELNRTMREDLGEGGYFYIEYSLKGELLADLCFACDKDTQKYEILREFFDDLDEDDDTFETIELCSNDEKGTTTITTTAKVDPKDLALVSGSFVSIMLDWLDILYEMTEL
ncbi:MAG: hypothetical protein IKD20_04250 [Clostridia bacterium]|nr:hypothetical protein [Clostridia bacterium]